MLQTPTVKVFGDVAKPVTFTAADLLAFPRTKLTASALAANALPFQIIMADEKHHARWVRQVVSIEVRPAP